MREETVSTQISSPILPDIAGKKHRFQTMKRESREKLLMAARTLFSEQGYHDVGPRDITRKAGVGVGTFYSFFEDKLDCFLSVTNNVHVELRDFASVSYSNGQNYPETLQLILKRLSHYSRENPGLIKMLWEDTRVLSSRKDQSNIWITEKFRSHLIQWRNRGDVNGDIDLELLSYLINGAVRQGVALIRRNPGNHETVTDSVVRFLMRGAGPGKDYNLDYDVWSGLVAKKIRSQRHETDHSFCPKGTAFSGKPETCFKLLTAARELFAERGYHEMGPEEISRRAGLSAATFYLYFKDKFDCFVAFINQATAEMEDLCRLYSGCATTFPQHVFAVINASFDYEAANPGILKAMLANVRVLSRKNDAISSVRSTMLQMENWKKNTGVEQQLDVMLLTYLIPGILKHGEAFLTQNPERKEEVLRGISSFIVRAMSEDGQPDRDDC